MTKLLLIEDDEAIAFGIAAALEKKGYRVTACGSVGQAKSLVSKDFQLILLDLNLPDGSGYEFCRWVKERTDIPVIFLTVRDEVQDITKGLDMGGDDYITKPFHIAVLESRIGAVLRRTQDDAKAVLTCGGLTLDKERVQLKLDGKEIALTALEFRLLYVLMENKGRTLPRNLILEKLWDAEGNFVNDNTLTVTIKRLREKLGRGNFITTVRGIGYRMEDTK